MVFKLSGGLDSSLKIGSEVEPFPAALGLNANDVLVDRRRAEVLPRVALDAVTKLCVSSVGADLRLGGLAHFLPTFLTLLPILEIDGILVHDYCIGRMSFNTKSIERTFEALKADIQSIAR
jgi:hypothetical protein